MEFNKPQGLCLSGNLAENFKYFKSEILVYIIATETDKKPREVQVARLKNLIGTDALRLYQNITKLEPSKETVQLILEELESYCTPKRNEIMEIYKFFIRKQAMDEPFEKFYADLQRLVKSCEFGEQEEKLLKTQIVLGVNSKNVQERLLRENTSLEKTVTFCKSVEMTEKNMKVISNSTERDLFAVSRTNNTDKLNKHNFQSKNSNYVANNRFNTFRNSNCSKCGTKHEINKCPAKGKNCFSCSKPNHFSPMCKSKKYINRQSRKAYGISREDLDTENDLRIDTIFSIDGKQPDIKDWYKEIKVENILINFKLDSGSQVNIIPYSYFEKLKLKNKIRYCNIKLEAYGGYKIIPHGQIQAKVKLGNIEMDVDFVVVKNLNTVPILGLPTCVKLNLINRLDNININEKTQFIERNIDVFSGLGEFPDMYSIKIKENATPKANPPRRIPFKIKDKLLETLISLESRGIITPVEEPLEWVHNLVVVEKPNKTLRVCIDPSELNKNIIREYYPIPTLEEISQGLSDKKWYCVFDLKDGFHQIKLDEKSSKLCTFSTPFGCYRYLRAPFGLSSIPEIFQKITNKYFSNLKGVTVYFDDILCSASSKEELQEIVEQVLERARKYNIKFNSSKVQYFVNEVKYFGLIFSEYGMKPDSERIRAIEELSEPKNKKDLQKMLGMINFLRNFIPNLAEITSPLRQLLMKNVEWLWTEAHSKSLSKIKSTICSASMLMPFVSVKHKYPV